MPPFDSKQFLKHLTSQPGVYQMIADNGQVLYVGKARNLKKRVSSYFKTKLDSAKTEVLMRQVQHVEVIVTASENEALLLEDNLIKKLKPRYNVLFRDDKSYPYICVSNRDFPQIDIYRGSRNKLGRYFGPFPSASAVRETLNLMQKLFKIRSCRDSFFAARTRPCLQYQIKRCSAPCVNYISQQEYQASVKLGVLFLEGKSDEIIDDLAKQMEQASQSLDFELAAKLRDQIANLRKIQEQQYISRDDGDVDVIAVSQQQSMSCVHMLYIRAGRVLGSKSFFPKTPDLTDEKDILNSFIPQYYLTTIHQQQIPELLILNYALDEQTWLETFLHEQRGKKVKITHQVRGQRLRWQVMAKNNADLALSNRLANHANTYNRFVALQSALHLENLPQRLECFDISHTGGEATVASCVVFDQQGPLKADYRRFNIKNITPGDDYAAMLQALTRRYSKLKTSEAKLPDILFIDGGKGQLHQAEKVLEELQINDVMIIGIAKGRSRKPGLETLFIAGRTDDGIHLAAESVALHLIQQIRDEAHRFAITGHRQQRGKARQTSSLENIEGVGQKRRQALLKHFGGLQGIREAGIEELSKVSGISPQLAEVIFNYFH